MADIRHWTERSPEDFFYSIATDFIEQLREKMEATGMKPNQLARAAKVSKSYISKVFKDPGNLSVETIVKLARTVGMKVSIITYEDINDPDNTRGPISADVFRRCWETAKRPADMWSFEAKAAETPAPTLDLTALMKKLSWGWEIYQRTADSGGTQNQTGTKVMYSSPQRYIKRKNTQKVDRTLSKHIQASEVSLNG